MRKIKFRGKNKAGKNVFMEFEQPIQFNGEEVTDVEQFVGYDADGKEIYEGDICQCEELGDCFIVLLGYSVPGYLPLNSKEIEWHLKERGENENLS